MNRFITISVGVWIFTLPFKNALFELSSAWLMGVTALLVIANRLQHSTKEIPKLPTLIPLSFLAVVIALLLANYLGRQTHHGYLIGAHFFVRYGGAFACLYYLHFQGYLTTRSVYNSIIVSLSMQAFLGLLQFITHFDYVRNESLLYGNRIYGGTFNPNPYGFLMALGASLCSWRCFDKSKRDWKIKAFYLLLLAIFMMTLILSGSRSSWIMYVVFLATIGFFNSHLKAIHTLGILSITTAATSCLYYLLPSAQTVIERAFLLDTSHRLKIWQTTLGFIQESPWFGYGPGDFKDLTKMVFTSVHNSVFEVLLFTGVFGLACFTALSFGILRLAKQSQSPGLFAIALSVLCVSLFDHSIVDSKIYLSVASLIAALSAIAWSRRNYMTGRSS